MGIRYISTLLPLVAPLVLTRADVVTNAAMLNRANGVRSLQSESELPAEGGTANDNAPDENSDAADPTVSAPIYSVEECDSWISTLITQDGDNSTGLSESEYHSFLSSIEEPPYISAYFEAYEGFDKLPWVFRVVHKSLACECEKLGFGTECCEGDDAELLLYGLQADDADDGDGTADNGVVAEYKDLFCQQISYVLTRSIPSPSPTAGPTASPTPSPSNSPTERPSKGPSLAPVTGSPTPAPSASPIVSAKEPTDAPSVSLVPSTALPVTLSVASAGSEVDEEEGTSTGLIIGIIVACLVLLLLALALVAYRRRQAEQDELRKFAGDQAPEQDLEAPPTADEDTEQAPAPEEAAAIDPPAAEPDEDDESSAPSVWSESNGDEDNMDELHEGHEDPSATAGSALAAMGAASTVAARIGTNTSD